MDAVFGLQVDWPMQRGPISEGGGLLNKPQLTVLSESSPGLALFSGIPKKRFREVG